MAVAPGVDAGQVEALLTGMRRRGAHVELVAPTLGAIETPRGSTLMPDRTFNACSPLDYDAVVVPDGDLHRLRDDGAAIAFAARAYLHGVPIGLVGAGAELLQGIAASPQDGGLGLLAVGSGGVGQRQWTWPQRDAAGAGFALVSWRCGGRPAGR